MSDELQQQMAALNAITQDIASEVLADVETAHPSRRPQSLNDPPQRPQPTAPVQQTQAPAQTQGSPVTQPTQGGQPAEGRRFAGKYLTVEELEKGAIHQQTLITKLQGELSQMRSAPTNAQVAPAPAAPRANPVSLGGERLAKLKTAFEEGREFPVQELTEAVAEIAENTVAQREAPRAAREAAMEYMQTNHPRFFDFQKEVAAHVLANPTLESVVRREMTRGNFEGAMETAWSNFALAAGVDVHQRMNANNAALNQEVEQARVDAGLVSTQAGGIHQAQPDPRVISAERLEQLTELSRAGYNMPLAREVFGASLPDDVFGV